MYDRNEDFLEWLSEVLQNKPKQYMTMLNIPRYAQAAESIKKIVTFVKKDCPDAEIKVYFDELTGTSLCLKIIADEFNVYKIKDFCEAIEPANTMDVIPRLDEKLEIGFTYEQAKMPMPPID